MHLAQLNLAHAKAAMDNVIMKDFVSQVDDINNLAKKSEGFIWSYSSDDDTNADGLTYFDSNLMLINMSVWQNRDSLFDFVYKSAHREVLQRKKEWFKKMPKMHMVLWYIPEHHIPTLEEAKERLTALQQNGESSYAFTFKSKY